MVGAVKKRKIDSSAQQSQEIKNIFVPKLTLKNVPSDSNAPNFSASSAVKSPELSTTTVGLSSSLSSSSSRVAFSSSAL